jgi:MFS family permease
MTTDATHLRSRFRWVICFIIFLATAIIYMDRQILSLLFPLLQKKFNWTNTDYALLNAWYQGGYALGLLGFGWLIDRVGIKIGYGASLFFWGIAAACHALVVTIAGVLGVSVFFALKGLRAFLGISEGGNFPAAIKTVGQWFPKTERAFATSMLNSGANVGALFAPAVVSWLVYHFAWQAPFAVASVAGFTWVVIWWLVYASPQNHPRVSSSGADLYHGGWRPACQRSRAKKFHGLGSLRFRATWAYVVGKFLTDPVWYFYLVWLPDFFKKTRRARFERELAPFGHHLRPDHRAEPGGRVADGASPAVELERDGVPQDGAFLFRPARSAHRLCGQCRRLDGGRPDRSGRSGASGVVLDPLHHRVRHVSEPGGRVGGGDREHGGLRGEHLLPAILRSCPGPLPAQPGAHQSYALLFGYCSGAYLVAFVPSIICWCRSWTDGGLLRRILGCYLAWGTYFFRPMQCPFSGRCFC